MAATNANTQILLQLLQERNQGQGNQGNQGQGQFNNQIRVRNPSSTPPPRAGHVRTVLDASGATPQRIRPRHVSPRLHRRRGPASPKRARESHPLLPPRASPYPCVARRLHAAPPPRLASGRCPATAPPATADANAGAPHARSPSSSPARSGRAGPDPAPPTLAGLSITSGHCLHANSDEPRFPRREP
nr:serine/arginine repetitive matrix protein 1-like [Aegilops tauschii subsp. strangulata]